MLETKDFWREKRYLLTLVLFDETVRHWDEEKDQ